MSVSLVTPDILRRVSASAPALLGWHPSGRSVRSLYLILLSLFAVLMVAGLVGYATFPHPANDYFAFDSFSRFIRSHEPSLIYDQARLRAFQNLPGHKVFAFMYPPGILLLLWPLASLPYGCGYVMWLGSGVAACVALIGVRRGGWSLGLLLTLAPSTLWTILCGQSTFFLAALILGGMLISRHRPFTAGILLGLATYKPQLGLLVPVALVAAGQWRTIAAAVMTFFAVVLVTTAGFGENIWPAWFYHLDSIMDVRTRHAADWAPLLSTVASDLSTLGVGRHLADVGQAVSAALAAVCVWFCFWQPGSQRAKPVVRLQVAALGAATFFATPFAFIYDLPLFTVALLLFVDERRVAGEAFGGPEILVIVAGLLAPVAFLVEGAHFCGSLIILAVLAAIMRRLRRCQRAFATSGLAGAGAPLTV